MFNIAAGAKNVLWPISIHVNSSQRLWKFVNAKRRSFISF